MSYPFMPAKLQLFLELQPKITHFDSKKAKIGSIFLL